MAPPGNSVQLHVLSSTATWSLCVQLMSQSQLPEIKQVPKEMLRGISPIGEKSTVDYLVSHCSSVA